MCDKMKRVFPRILLIFIVLSFSIVIAGCSEDNGEPPPSGKPLASALIRAESGGIVTVEPPHLLADTSIAIPAGALEQDTRISIDETDLPNLSQVIGPTIRVEPEGTVFTIPATVTIAYDETALPEGMTESMLSIAKIETDGTLVPLPNREIDTIANTVSGKTSSLSIFVLIENNPPVADAGSEQTVFVGDTVQLDGNGSSDVDGDTLTFTWSFITIPEGSTAALSDPAAVKPSFVADRPGTYVVQLILNDGSMDSEPDVITIEAQGPATSLELQNRIFLFPDGAVFGEELLDIRVELTFGDFRGNAGGPFMLRALDVVDTEGQLAKVEGTVNASCTFLIETSSFNPEIFPQMQPGHIISMDFCGIDEEGRLRVVNANTGTSASSHPASRKSQYNFVIILTDDQRWDTLWAMPLVQKKLIAQGVTFVNAFVSTPICCPTRASLLAGGFYAHHAGVLTNNLPNGSAQKFQDTETLATLLQQRGYRTAFVGKYMNGYPEMAPYIPPGWTYFVETSAPRPSWFNFNAVFGSSDQQATEGEIQRISQYITDFHKDQALEFLDQNGDAPFFLLFSPNAVHTPTTPAPEDEKLFLDYQYRERAYGEKELSDKPVWVQRIRNACKGLQKERDEEIRDQLRSLQAIDRAVEAIVEKIEDKGLLDKTVFIFTSDNGYMWCEHGVFAKGVHYEESIRVPFVFVMPGIEARIDEHFVVSPLDIGPTIFELVGLSKRTDGVSLVPLVRYSDIPWREAFLIEHFGATDFGSYGQWGVWSGLRIKNTHEEWKYVEYPTGEIELYDLLEDPFEEESKHDDPAYQDIIRDFAERLDRVRGLAVTVFEAPKGIVGQHYTFQLTAWGGQKPYRWDVVEGTLPAGLFLNSSTGLISGIPGQPEVQIVQIRVMDSSVAIYTGQPQSFIQEFTITINSL